MADHAALDPCPGDELLRAFYGLLVGDLFRPLFRFRKIFRFHAVCGGEAGFFVKVAHQFLKQFAVKKS